MTTESAQPDTGFSSALDDVDFLTAEIGLTNGFIIDHENYEASKWVEILDEFKAKHIEWGKGLQLIDDFGMVYFEQDSNGVVTLGMDDPNKLFE